jgi:hypothetical protein
MDHEWSGWPEDESHLHESLGDADTADLADSDAGLGGLPVDHDFGDPGQHEPELHDPELQDPQPHDGGADDDFEGFGQPDDPAAHGGHEPLPDDTFGEHPDDGEPFDLGAGDHAGYPEPAAHDGLAGYDDGADHGATEAGLHDDAPHQEGFGDAGAGEHLVGTDPDLDAHTDDPGWHDATFPPPLGWDHVPEPVDGFPWSDPDVLGHEVADPAGQFDGAYGSPPVSDLFEYAGLDAPADGDAWAQLLGSEDPATGALARWWAPGS